MALHPASNTSDDNAKEAASSPILHDEDTASPWPPIVRRLRSIGPLREQRQANFTHLGRQRRR